MGSQDYHSGAILGVKLPNQPFLIKTKKGTTTTKIKENHLIN